MHNLKPVLADRFLESLKTVEYFAGKISQNCHIPQLVAEANRLFPFRSEECHLKRIKSFEDNGNKICELLLCLKSLIHSQKQAYDQSQLDINNIAPNFNQELRQYISKIKTVLVPLTKPITSIQFSESKNYWPCSFSHYPHIEKLISPEPVSYSEFEQMQINMCEAIKLAKDNLKIGAPPISAVMVDPSQNKVVARCVHSIQYPLAHAIMRCIEVATEKPTVSTTSNVNENQLSENIGKKRIHWEDANNLQNNSVDNNNSANIKSNNNGTQYLCTGYDVYTTQEPCIMCSMALVHARVRRVIIGRVNKSMGGLGSVIKLHCYEAINHHFDVFTGMMEDECNKLWTESNNINK